MKHIPLGTKSNAHFDRSWEWKRGMGCYRQVTIKPYKSTNTNQPS